MKKTIDLTKLSQAELISLLQQSQEREALLEQKVVKANGELAEVNAEFAKVKKEYDIAKTQIAKVRDLIFSYMQKVQEAVLNKQLKTKFYSDTNNIPNKNDLDGLCALAENYFDASYKCLTREYRNKIKGLNPSSETSPLGTDLEHSAKNNNRQNNELTLKKCKGHLCSEELQSKLADDCLNQIDKALEKAYAGFAQMGDDVQESEQASAKSEDQHNDDDLSNNASPNIAKGSGDNQVHTDRKQENTTVKERSLKGKTLSEEQKQKIANTKAKNKAKRINEGEVFVSKLLKLRGFECSNENEKSQQQQMLQELFRSDNRGSKDSIAPDREVYGLLTPPLTGELGTGVNENGQIWCPHCQLWEDVELISNGDPDNRLIHIRNIRIEQIIRLSKKYKCKNCGSMITSRLTANANGIYYRNSVEQKALDENKDEIADADLVLKSHLPDHKLSPMEFSLCSLRNLRPKNFDFELAERFPLLDGGKLTLGSAVHIVESRFSQITPYNRQIGAHGLNIPKSTVMDCIKSLARLVSYQIATRLIKPMILNECNVIHMDESNIHVRAADSNGKKNRQFTCWGISSSVLSGFNYSWYRIDESHGQDVAVDILREGKTDKSKFKNLMTDGNNTYNQVAEDHSVVHVYCLAHCRRKVIDALEKMNILKVYNSVISKCLSVNDFYEEFVAELKQNEDLSTEDILVISLFFNINTLFALEHFLKISDIDYLKKVATIRSTFSVKALENIEEILNCLAKKSINMTKDKNGNTVFKDNGQTCYGEAVAYLYKRLDGIKAIFNDPEIPLTNSLQERAFRDFAVSKHSSLFIDSIDGCTTLASHLSVIMSCYKSGINPYDYLVWFTFNFYQRFQRMYPKGKIQTPKAQLLELEQIPVDERDKYKTKSIDKIEYAIIPIYDKRYECPLDSVSVDGLSIMDYKRLCLQGYV